MHHLEKVFSSVCSELAPCWLHWMPLFVALEEQSIPTHKMMLQTSITPALSHLFFSAAEGCKPAASHH